MARKPPLLFIIGLVTVSTVAAQYATRPNDNVQQTYNEQLQYQPQQRQLADRSSYGAFGNVENTNQPTSDGQSQQVQQQQQQQYNTQPRTAYTPYGNQGSGYNYPYNPQTSNQQQPQQQQYYGNYQRKRRTAEPLTINTEPGAQFYPVNLETAIVPNVVAGQNPREPRVAEILNTTTESSVPSNVLVPTTTENVGLTSTSTQPALRKEGRALPLWALSPTGDDSVRPYPQPSRFVQISDPAYAYNTTPNNNYGQFYNYPLSQQQQQEQQRAQLLQIFNSDNIGFQQQQQQRQLPQIQYSNLPEAQQSVMVPSGYSAQINFNNDKQPSQPRQQSPYPNPIYNANRNEKAVETIFIEEASTPLQKQQQQQKVQLQQFLEQPVVTPVVSRQESPTDLQQPTNYFVDNRSPGNMEAIRQYQPQQPIGSQFQQLPPPSAEFVNRKRQQPQQPQPKQSPQQNVPPPTPPPPPPRAGQEPPSSPPPPPLPKVQLVKEQQVFVQPPQQQNVYYSQPLRELSYDLPSQKQQPYYNANLRQMNEINDALQPGTSQIPQTHQQHYFLDSQNMNDAEPAYIEQVQNSAFVPIPTAVIPLSYEPMNQQQTFVPQYQVIPQNILQQQPQQFDDYIVPVDTEALPPIEGEVLRQNRVNSQPIVGLNPRLLINNPQLDAVQYAYGPPAIGLTMTVGVNETGACRKFLDLHPMRVNSSTNILSVHQTLLDNPVVRDVPTAQVMICCVHKYTRFGLDKPTFDNNGNPLPCDYVLTAFVEQIRTQKLERLQQQQITSNDVTTILVPKNNLTYSQRQRNNPAGITTPQTTTSTTSTTTSTTATPTTTEPSTTTTETLMLPQRDAVVLPIIAVQTTPKPTVVILPPLSSTTTTTTTTNSPPTPTTQSQMLVQKLTISQ